MKIALLNPWIDQSAEHSMASNIIRVAAALGHSAVECQDTTEVLAAQPDFVLAMSISHPKTTPFPTYSVMYHPRGMILPHREELQHLFTYDGFLTVTPSMKAFLHDVLFSARRTPLIGDFFPTCPTLDWPEPIDFGAARLAYLGTNWDAKSDLGHARKAGLFRRLDGCEWMEVYGPEDSWAFLTDTGERVYRSYKGIVPFDGVSALHIYRAAGAGLCLHSAYHEADDTVSIRVFEISAAGAICIAQRLPWIEEHFGDTVLYVDRDVPDAEVAQQIDGHMRWIRSHPADAAAKADGAHRIFRNQFSLEVGLPAVFDLHRRYLESRRQPPAPGPLVSVIVRAGGRPDAFLRRAVASIAAQHHHRIELVLVLHQDYDPGPVLADVPQRFETITILPTPGANRSKALWTGLAACTGEYISVLDDDDEWLPEHLDSLVGRLDGGRGDVAVAGSIRHSRRPVALTRGVKDVRKIASFLLNADGEGVIGMVAHCPVQALLFRRSLLDEWLLQDPQMDTAEDSYLALCLLEHAKPRFSYRATAVLHETADASNWHEHPRRSEDLLKLRLRFLGHPFAAAPQFIRPEDIKAQGVGDPRVRRSGSALEYIVPASYAEWLGLETTWEEVPVPVAPADVTCLNGSRVILDQPLQLMMEQHTRWAYGLQIGCRWPDQRPYVARLSIDVASGVAGFGVLNHAEDDFLYRVFVTRPEDVSGPVLVYLPIVRPAEAGRLVVQMGDTDETTRVTIHALTFLSPRP